ncbi:Histone-lysine N-methyltransferase [Wickerhamomyces ciferrii]|uniref:Histone-lysine N-methyltransferase n=1 Tax=Wickerhamomyces ciferrii (strain ATCC 14091 / BCRC 22168 / CBS 111 / JCM 3599 / NBRC 0793 / NRRL Y-1031 F-60-10) TaxID=1206466 RepID=K0KAU8_WICCF|nr:Histone-lysine N-methyltransferase [Wickerhamomyces ciferrii]CCH42125.1 Histone-lysine N-methyltransferase [Wickerhamomyces ciferrii]
MVYGKHIKVSCQVCIIGHGTKSCNHKSIIESDNPGYNGHRGCLEVISKKGRRKSRIPDRIDGVGNTNDDTITLNPNNDKFILIEAELIPKLNEWCPNSQNFRYECDYPCCKKISKDLYINEETSSFLRVPHYCDLTSIEDAKKIGTPVSYKDLPTEFLNNDVNFHSIAKLYPDKSDYPIQTVNPYAETVLKPNPQSTSDESLNVQSSNNSSISATLNTNPIIPSYSAELNYQVPDVSLIVPLNSNSNGSTNQQHHNNQIINQNNYQTQYQQNNNHYNRLNQFSHQNNNQINYQYQLNDYQNRNYQYQYNLQNQYNYQNNSHINNHNVNNTHYFNINGNTNQNNNAINHNTQHFVSLNGLNNLAYHNHLAANNSQSLPLRNPMISNPRPYQPSIQSNPIIPNNCNNYGTSSQQLNFVFEDPSKYSDDDCEEDSEDDSDTIVVDHDNYGNKGNGYDYDEADSFLLKYAPALQEFNNNSE